MRNRKPICIAITLVLILLIGIAAVIISDKPVTPQENKFMFPEIIGNGSDGFTAHTKATASIPAVTGIELESNQLAQNVEFYNPEENPCAFVISLYLGDGTLVFTTDSIYPGQTVNDVNLTVKLDSGVYSNAILVYDCYSVDEEMTPLTRCELIIEINSK